MLQVKKTNKIIFNKNIVAVANLLHAKIIFKQNDSLVKKPSYLSATLL